MSGIAQCQSGLKDEDGLTAFEISLQSAGVNESLPTLFYRSMLDQEEIEPLAALLRGALI